MADGYLPNGDFCSMGIWFARWRTGLPDGELEFSAYRILSFDL